MTFQFSVRPSAAEARWWALRLLERLDDEQPTVTTHVDLAAGDRAGETERHLAAGATIVEKKPHWTVLRDPVGRTYCITARKPGDV